VVDALRKELAEANEDNHHQRAVFAEKWSDVGAEVLSQPRS
jgi:hypothetical protein